MSPYLWLALYLTSTTILTAKMIASNLNPITVAIIASLLVLADLRFFMDKEEKAR